jgi:hypothetical protein
MAIGKRSGLGFWVIVAASGAALTFGYGRERPDEGF